MSMPGGGSTALPWEPWGGGAPTPPPPAPRSRSGWLIAGVVAGVVLLVAVLGSAGLVAEALSRTGPPFVRAQAHGATPVSIPQPPVTATQGSRTFEDRFKDPRSGWDVGTLSSGTRASYGPRGYTVASVGSLRHQFDAPLGEPLWRLSLTTTATLGASGHPASATVVGGVGLTCRAGSGASAVTYAFLAESGSRYAVLRTDGLISSGSTVVRSGLSSAAPGRSPVTVVAMCLGTQSSSTTRLVLFIDGVLAVDFADDDAAVALTDGWHGGLLTDSVADQPSTAVFSDYVERNLG